MFRSFLSLGIVLILLCACGDPKVNEARLEKGCKAAVHTILAKDQYDRQLSQVKEAKFGMADGFRLVTLDVVTKNKSYGYDQDEIFSCKFEESSSFGGMNWKAALVQVKVDEDIYGAENGKIYGDMMDHMNLVAAVEAAMK